MAEQGPYTKPLRLMAEQVPYTKPLRLMAEQGPYTKPLRLMTEGSYSPLSPWGVVGLHICPVWFKH